MSVQKTCEHCNEPIVISTELKINNTVYLFCCNGCKTVFEILTEKKLDNYYNLRANSDKTQFNPVKQSKSKYEYLDEKEFINNHSKKMKNSYQMSFYIEGVHCLACLWLIEKIHEFDEDILLSKLDMSKSVVEVTISNKGKFSKVAKILETIGYPPHPIIEDLQAEKFKKKETQKQMIKIAVAFFCAGNIMLLSFSIYAGADEDNKIKTFFDFLTLILSIPVLTYSSTSFYSNAITSIKNKIISIDFPIVLALILGSIFSIYNIFNHGTHIYFDSLTTLVFLLLTSRFILKEMQQKGLSASDVSSFFSNISSYRIKDGTQEEVYAKYLKVNDIIKVYPGDTIPSDAQIIKGSTYVNNSLMTGESKPILAKKNDKIYSGSVNIQNEINAKVLKTANSSRLGQILKSVEKGWHSKTDIIRFTDKVSKYFVLSVFTLAILVFLYFLFEKNLETAITRALTLIIITCPCALGLTTPLSLTLTLSRLSRLGIIIKDESIIEKITKAKNIVFDKTGTLTFGNFRISHTEVVQDIGINHDLIAYSLEANSRHPIAESLKKYFKHTAAINDIKLEKLILDDFKEIVGVGPQAYYKNNFYELKSTKRSNLNQTCIGLYKNNILTKVYYLEDSVKEHSSEIIESLQKKSLKTFLLSGDSKSIVQYVGKKVSIPEENIFFELTPEDKKQFIDENPNTIMVGDGANDAIALGSSLVGVAVHGSVDLSLRASDVFMAEGNLKNIDYLVSASFETIKLIKRNLIFSIIYNVFGIILSINGMITPLTAAILMPLSSLTVLLSTFISTKQLRVISKSKTL